MSGFHVLYYLLEFSQTHVRWVDDAIQPSHPLLDDAIQPSHPFSSCPQCLPASGSFPVSWIFTSGGQSIRASASVSISPSNEYSKLISFRLDWFDLLEVQGTLKSLLQHHSSKVQFFVTQSSLWSSFHIHTGLLEKPQLWLHEPLLANWCLCFLILYLGSS